MIDGTLIGNALFLMIVIIILIILCMRLPFYGGMVPRAEWVVIEE